MTKDRFARIFNWVRQRCNNPKSDSYFNWGLRWIKCNWIWHYDFWIDMHDSYLEHVKIYWEKETTLDRIDNDWNYCKENCRRATMKVQQNNRRNNIKKL